MRIYRRRSFLKFLSKIFILSFPASIFNSSIIHSFGASKKKLKKESNVLKAIYL